MEQFVNLTVSGAVTGAIFALIAAGIVLSYAATGIFNFGYGAMAFVSGFLYYELHTGLNWPVIPAVLVVVGVFAPLLGAGLNAAVFRPLARATDAAKIMATIGVMLALPAAAQFLVRRGVAIFDWGIPDGSLIHAQSGVWATPPHVWQVAGVRITSNDAVMLVVTALVAVVLYVLLQRTRLGLTMKAVTDRPGLAALRGVSERRTSNAAWVIGAMLAALAGVVGAPYFGPLEPSRYTQFLFIAATAAVVARMRSIPIAILAGLGLGVVKNWAAVYAGFARNLQGFENAVPFVVMFAGLVVLGRERGRLAGTAAVAEPPAQYASDLGVWRRRLPWIVAGGALLVLVVFVLDDFWLRTVAFGAALSIVYLSFVLVTGLGGMVSLAQASFVTMGGLAAGMLSEQYGLPFLAALAVGAAAAAVLGMIAALPSLRLGGLALALATLALALVGESLLFQWDWIRHGQQGWRIAPPELGPVSLRDPLTLALVFLAAVGLAALFVRAIERSSLGRGIVAVNDSAPAAAAAGIGIARSKLAVFGLSAAVAGIGGVLLAVHQGNITNRTFPAEIGLLWLAIAVLFGIRRIGGAVVGGLVTAVSGVWFRNGWQLPDAFPTWLDWGGAGDEWSRISAVLFGLGAIQLARNPHGVLAIVGEANRVRRDRREPDTTAPPSVQEPVASSTAAVGLDPAAPAPVLVLDDVRAGYGPVPVLHGVTLELRKGKLLALVGPNGAGKSTLCLTASGVISPTAGEIRFEGVDLASAPPYVRARHGVVLAPEGRGVFPGLTVDENLAVWLNDAAQREAVYERIPMLGRMRARVAGTLSGGEQQILALAGVTQRPPSVLIADEPSLGLAPRIVVDVLNVLQELRDRGVAVLLAEERATGILNTVDEVAVLQLGLVVWSGPASEIPHDRLIGLYLGKPARPPRAPPHGAPEVS